MAAYPTTALQESTLDLIKSGTPHLALFTSSPNANGGGTEVGGSYTRKPITYGAISGGVMSNTAAMSFTNLPTATITHYAVMSAATGGTMHCYGALSTPVSAATGDQLQFAIGEHSLSFQGS